MKNALIVEDHYITSIGMALIIEKVYKQVSLTIKETFREALVELRENRFDLVILDIGLADGEEITMISKMKNIQQDLRILVSSARDELQYGPLYLQVGALGYLNKNAHRSEIALALETVMANKRYVSHQLQQNIITQIFDPNKIAFNPLNELSTRERQVFDLILKGKGIKEIAHILNLQYSTVSTQKAKIFQKYNVSNIIELVRKVDILADV